MEVTFTKRRVRIAKTVEEHSLMQPVNDNSAVFQPDCRSRSHEPGSQIVEDRNFGLQISELERPHQRHSRQVQCLPYVVYA